MATVIIEENQDPLLNPYVTSFRQAKDNEEFSVLSEIEIKINNQVSNTSTSDPTTSSSYSLKRKRPPKLQIPPALPESQTGESGCREKTFDDENGFDDSRCGVFFKKGKKKIMEDTHKIVSRLYGDSKKGFFGIYDGHGGRKAAEFVAENLHENILRMLEECKGDMGKVEAIKAGYLKTDKEFLKQGLASGTCCVTAFIDEGSIVVSNLGDCRAVLCRGGVAEALTTDHTAERLDERNRIEDKGGYVDIHRGTWRVQGILAVSRSIGDAHLKEWLLAEPDTKMLSLTSDMEFLILASDGLWDKVGNQEAVDTAVHFQPINDSRSDRGCREDEDDGFGSENISPPSKSRRISLDHALKVRSWCQNQGNGFQSDKNNSGAETGQRKEDDDGFGCENTSPPSKVRRISLGQSQNVKTWHPNQENANNRRSFLNRKEEEEDIFGCEITSPESNTTGISVGQPQKVKTWHPNKENCYKKRSSPRRLMAACKELINLATIRGSSDDITVMIIDLKNFHRN